MRLALAAKVKVDPKRLLADRWVHDTARAMACSVLKERDRELRERSRRY